MDPYEALANAIILRAAADYRIAYRRLLRRPNDRSAKRECEKLEEFFYSPWFETLSDADGPKLLTMLEEKIRREVMPDEVHTA